MFAYNMIWCVLWNIFVLACPMWLIKYFVHIQLLTRFVLAPLDDQKLDFVLGSLFTKCDFSDFYAPIFPWSAFVGYINQTSAPKSPMNLCKIHEKRVNTDCAMAGNYSWEMHILCIYWWFAIGIRCDKSVSIHTIQLLVNEFFDIAGNQSLACHSFRKFCHLNRELYLYRN